MDEDLQSNAGQLIIAVPTAGNGGLEEKLGQHFGRCECFTLVEVKDKAIAGATVLHNLSDSGCVGVLDLLRFHQASAVIARHIGQRPLAACQLAGLPVYRGRGPSVRAAVEHWLAGELDEIEEDSSCNPAGGPQRMGQQMHAAGQGRCHRQHGPRS